jgi:hypothetical protein
LRALIDFDPPLLTVARQVGEPGATREGFRVEDYLFLNLLGDVPRQLLVQVADFQERRLGSHDEASAFSGWSASTHDASAYGIAMDDDGPAKAGHYPRP